MCVNNLRGYFKICLLLISIVNFKNRVFHIGCSSSICVQCIRMCYFCFFFLHFSLFSRLVLAFLCECVCLFTFRRSARVFLVLLVVI